MRILLSFLLVVAGAAPAAATIVGGAVTGGFAFDNGGVFVKLTVPFTESDPDNAIGNNTLQTWNLYAFDEDQNILLMDPLAVNILADGLGGGLGPGELPAGSTVASHYIAYDPAGGTRRSQVGTVSFDSDVVGVITSRQLLIDSDGLQNNAVSYLSPSARGLEGNDSVTITGLQEITVDWGASSPGDYVRVLTAFSPLPEPGPLALLACSVTGLALRARGWR